MGCSVQFPPEKCLYLRTITDDQYGRRHWLRNKDLLTIRGTGSAMLGILIWLVLRNSDRTMYISPIKFSRFYNFIATLMLEQQK